MIVGRSHGLATIKTLFAEAVDCAFPGCNEALLLRDRGQTSVTAEIAHVRSGAASGPRHDPAYPPELVDSDENLVLLCRKHHVVVDRHDARYTVDELLEWKSAQRRRAGAGTAIDDTTAEEVAECDWGPLEHGHFPLLSTTVPQVLKAFELYSVEVHKYFAATPRSFTIVARISTVEAGANVSLPVLEMYSHWKEPLCHAAEAHQQLMRYLAELRLSEGDGMCGAASQRVSAATREIEDWEIRLPDQLASLGWTPIRVHYEPRLKRVSFARLPGRRSLREYQSRLSATSDALEFLAATTQHGFGVVESIEALTEQPAGMRLVAYILDSHTVDFDRFRVRHSAPDIWDYFYPKFDAEVEERSLLD
jgi:hypothetical protein